MASTAVYREPIAREGRESSTTASRVRRCDSPLSGSSCLFRREIQRNSPHELDARRLLLRSSPCSRSPPRPPAQPRPRTGRYGSCPRSPPKAGDLAELPLGGLLPDRIALRRRRRQQRGRLFAVADRRRRKMAGRPAHLRRAEAELPGKGRIARILLQPARLTERGLLRRRKSLRRGRVRRLRLCLDRSDRRRRAPGRSATSTANGGGATHLIGVSCPSPSLCVAVSGGSNNANGGKVLTSTNPASGNWKVADLGPSLDLRGVSCGTPSLCVAVAREGRMFVSTDPTGGASAWTGGGNPGRARRSRRRLLRTRPCSARPAT